MSVSGTTYAQPGGQVVLAMFRLITDLRDNAAAEILGAALGDDVEEARRRANRDGVPLIYRLSIAGALIEGARIARMDARQIVEVLLNPVEETTVLPEPGITPAEWLADHDEAAQALRRGPFLADVVAEAEG